MLIACATKYQPLKSTADGGVIGWLFVRVNAWIWYGLTPETPFKLILILYLDIDECAENPSTCDKGAICQNQLGSYICVKKPESKEKTCQSGFVLENDRCVGMWACNLRQYISLCQNIYSNEKTRAALFSTDNLFEINVSISLLLQNLPLLKQCVIIEYECFYYLLKTVIEL